MHFNIIYERITKHQKHFSITRAHRVAFKKRINSFTALEDSVIAVPLLNQISTLYIQQIRWNLIEQIIIPQRFPSTMLTKCDV